MLLNSHKLSLLFFMSFKLKIWTILNLSKKMMNSVTTDKMDFHMLFYFPLFKFKFDKYI